MYCSFVAPRAILFSKAFVCFMCSVVCVRDLLSLVSVVSSFIFSYVVADFSFFLNVAAVAASARKTMKMG